MTMSADCRLCDLPCTVVYVRNGQLVGCDRCVTAVPIYDYVTGEGEERGEDDDI